MLIVNKHCAIFTTSIKWTPSVIKADTWEGPDGVSLCLFVTQILNGAWHARYAGSYCDVSGWRRLACVAWRFWLGALSNIGGRSGGQKTAMLRSLGADPPTST